MQNYIIWKGLCMNLIYECLCWYMLLSMGIVLICQCRVSWSICSAKVNFVLFLCLIMSTLIELMILIDIVLSAKHHTDDIHLLPLFAYTKPVCVPALHEYLHSCTSMPITAVYRTSLLDFASFVNIAGEIWCW